MTKDEAEAGVMDALMAWFVMDDAPSLLAAVQCVMMKWSLIAMTAVKMQRCHCIEELLVELRA